MNKRTQSLYNSLVGGSIEFSFKKKLDGALGIDKNIQVARERIKKNVALALEAGGKTAVMLLAELTAFYAKEPYYMAVRGEIEMRRYRPMVLEYMELDVQERAERLHESLEVPIHKDKFREAKVEALRYFLTTYVGRIKDFRSLLTKEEYLIIV